MAVTRIQAPLTVARHVKVPSRIVCNSVDSSSDCLMMMHHSMHWFPPTPRTALVSSAVLERFSPLFSADDPY